VNEGSNRDKASLDIFWLKDKSLEQPDNLSDPDVLGQEIVEDLEAALETIPRNRHRKRSIDAFQFNLRISYRSVFAVTCGLANRLCRRFVINAILPKILCF